MTGRKHLVICIPTFGITSMRWNISCWNLRTPGNTIISKIIKEGSIIDEARNHLVEAALNVQNDPTHLFFIDDDVILHPHVLLQLLDSINNNPEIRIISGVYYTKSDYSIPLIFNPPGHGIGEYIPGSGVKKYWGHGMGICLIDLDVFRVMKQTLDLGTDRNGNFNWFYTSGDKPGEGLTCTEDMWFCTHAHKAGFDSYIDMHPYALGWHYDYKTRQGYPIDQWKEFLDTGTVTFNVSDSQNTNNINVVVENPILQLIK